MKYNKCQEKIDFSHVRQVEILGKTYYFDLETGALQEIFEDVAESGKIRPWKKHKEECFDISNCYDMLSHHHDDYYYKKARRVETCGDVLIFDKYERGNKLKYSNCCHVRLCPLCGWRRSLKIQSNFRMILNDLDYEKYSFIVVTLTVPNVSAEKLNSAIDDMMSGYKALCKLPEFKKAVVGWYRALEVIRSVDHFKFQWRKTKNGRKYKHYLRDLNGELIDNPSYGTYHPHFHCVFVVKKNYFSGKNYLKNSDWLRLWQTATGNKDIKIVDVRRARPKPAGTAPASAAVPEEFGIDDIMSAICEVAKYTVKNADIINSLDWKMSSETVLTLDAALNNRRLVAWGGILKDIKKKLVAEKKIEEDEIDGNLVNVGDISEDLGEKLGELIAFWHTGFNNYIVR